jgi:hypothetical protein
MPPEDRARLKHDTFSPDGNDAFNRTGIINFYTNGISDSSVNMILAAVRYYLGDLGVRIGDPKPETYEDKLRSEFDRIQQHGDDEYHPEYPEIVPKTVKEKQAELIQYFNQRGWDHKAIRVYRIPVISRDRSKEPLNQAPTLNLANGTAEHIFGNLLQLHHYDHGSGYGPIPVADLRVKIETLEKWHIQNATTPNAITTGEKGATIISQGYSEDRMERILRKISDICRWAQENGHDYIVVH